MRRIADADELARGPLPDLTHEEILTWADSHRERTGTWPVTTSGEIAGSEYPGERWETVEAALALGRRGLPGQETLARLLARERGKAYRPKRPPLSVKRILAWARAHRSRTGEWPGPNSGRVIGERWESWPAIDQALTYGRRGLTGGRSLVHLLAAHGAPLRGVAKPRLTVDSILTWARAHRSRTGEWPGPNSGRVIGKRCESWPAIDQALTRGLRGLTAGQSLVYLLAAHGAPLRGVAKPSLTVDSILTWARRHHERSGKWPKPASGPIQDAPGETWAMMEHALKLGLRGMPGGSSLARLLAKHGGPTLGVLKPRLTVKRILVWARKHQQRTGSWPGGNSGPVEDAPGETWVGITIALRRGLRGLPGGLSLHQLAPRSRWAQP